MILRQRGGDGGEEAHGHSPKLKVSSRSGLVHELGDGYGRQPENRFPRMAVLQCGICCGVATPRSAGAALTAPQQDRRDHQQHRDGEQRQRDRVGEEHRDVALADGERPPELLLGDGAEDQADDAGATGTPSAACRSRAGR